MAVTLKSLQGTSIEDFGVQLGRTWKIGQAGKNNGVLLIVAPNERKVRIEVGYGLEGTLTDAISKFIIENSIIPRFKAGDFAGGIRRGVDDLLTVLSGEREKIQQLAARHEPDPVAQFYLIIYIAMILGIVILFYVTASTMPRSNVPGRSGSMWGALASSSSTGSWSWSSSSDSSDSFSSGGGDFGGGGSSGSW